MKIQIDLDVEKVEIIKAIKLTKDAALPYSHTVPRKRLEYFQDDLFPNTRAVQSIMSNEEFFSGKYGDNGMEPKKVSLNTKNLVTLQS